MSSPIIEKLKEPAISVIPVMTIVVVLHCTIAPLGLGQLPRLVVSRIFRTFSSSQSVPVLALP